jgi:glycosyltransferase involved in cell wall biosynthesis
LINEHVRIFSGEFSILFPIYNEIQTLDELVNSWLKIVQKLPSGSILKFEDAGSTDGTKERLLDFAKKNPKHIVVDLREYRDGYSNSVRRLLETTQTRWAFVSDSDGQYRPEDFWEYLKKIGPTTHFIKGQKVNRKDQLYRRICSRLLNRFISEYFGFPFMDYNSAHYLISIEHLRELTPSKFYFHDGINIEITLRSLLSNCSYEIVYINHIARLAGKSQVSPFRKYFSFGFKNLQDVRNLKRQY